MTQNNDKMTRTQFMWAIGISIISWSLSWIILAIKLDFMIFMGFVLYGLGLSGLIIFVFVPKMILFFNEEAKQE